MSRFVSPITDLKPNGSIYFFESQTNTPKSTYKDEAEEIDNPDKVVVLPNGNLPNVFYSGVAKVIFLDEFDVQYAERDPVGTGSSSGNFYSWIFVSSYNKSAIVLASDGYFYKSLVGSNTGHDPVTSSGYWQKLDIIYNWASNADVSTNDIVTDGSGLFWKALTDSTGLNPTTNDGTNWQQIKYSDFYASGSIYSKNSKVINLVNGRQYISVIDSNSGNDPESDDGTNWQLDNPTLDWVIGRSYLSGEQSYSTVDNRRYKAVIDNAGNEPSVDDGTNWIPTDGVVTTPVNALPADEAIDVIRTPLLTVNTYSVTGSDAAQEWIQYQLSDDEFATVYYDSGITRDFDGHAVSTQLSNATEYSYRALTKGVRTDITDWSDVTTFTTTASISELFSITEFTGTALVRGVVTGIDLSASTGSIWIKNRDDTGFIKQLDTIRSLDELDIAEDTPEAVNANGLQDYLSTGFEVGTDSDYNGSGETISSYTFKESPGFYDTVQYVGNGTERNISHSLGVEVGAMIVKNMDASAGAANRHWLYHRSSTPLITSGRSLDGSNNSSGLFVAATTTTFGVSTSASTNNTGDNYIAELIAHNPTSGTYCGTYIGTGAPQDIVTGFPVGMFITIYVNAVTGGTMIADVKAGTGSHLFANTSGNAEVAGSVASFNSDGVTLDGNNLNVIGETYYFIAMADPDLF